VDAVGEPVLEVAGAPPAVAGQPAEHDWVHQEPDRVNGVFVAKTGSQRCALDDARHDPGSGRGTLRVELARESRDLVVRARCFVHHRQQARDAVGNGADGVPGHLKENPDAAHDSSSLRPIGTTTVRVEVFADDPDTYVERAIAAGADGALDPMRDHQTPWGTHRQGGFHDPFGHVWLVGDKSPLRRFRG
jgi:hypothetical protein